MPVDHSQYSQASQSSEQCIYRTQNVQRTKGVRSPGYRKMLEVVQPLVLADSMNTWPKLGTGLVSKKSRYSSMNLMAGGISLWAL